MVSLWTEAPSLWNGWPESCRLGVISICPYLARFTEGTSFKTNGNPEWETLWPTSCLMAFILSSNSLSFQQAGELSSSANSRWLWLSLEADVGFRADIEFSLMTCSLLSRMSHLSPLVPPALSALGQGIKYLGLSLQAAGHGLED